MQTTYGGQSQTPAEIPKRPSEWHSRRSDRTGERPHNPRIAAAKLKNIELHSKTLHHARNDSHVYRSFRPPIAHHSTVYNMGSKKGIPLKPVRRPAMSTRFHVVRPDHLTRKESWRSAPAGHPSRPERLSSKSPRPYRATKSGRFLIASRPRRNSHTSCAVRRRWQYRKSSRAGAALQPTSLDQHQPAYKGSPADDGWAQACVY